VGMKLKTSVTLSEDIVKMIDKAAGPDESRSQTIDRLLRERLASIARQAADDHDRSLIDQHAAKRNAELANTLGHQAGDR
jgi:metal-responsive CopG/Arc/MetJ family transcriptional regulator